MWDQGYISEIDYIYGYFAEQSPARMRLALLSRGIANRIGPSSSYLELGFGQGLTLAVNAATSEGQYHGTDFNPSQASSAQLLGDATERDIRIFEDSFEELVARPDLPEFDIIALHGIWSWVSDESRQAIVQLARNKLKPGGAFYVSYNVAPGWSPATPLRHLLSQYAKRAATGPILSRVEQSLDFVQSVIDNGAQYSAQNPSLAERLNQIRKHNRTYVTHEYFNQNWHPMSFVDISDQLAEAKLNFGASANLLDNLDGLSVPAAAHAVLDGIADENLRQLTRDFFVSQQFRRDIFIKGARQMSRGELRVEANAQEFVLVGDATSPPRKIVTSAGEAELRPDIYDPITQAIGASPNSPVSLAQLQTVPELRNLGEWQIWEALLVLSGINWLSPRSPSAGSDTVRKASMALNLEILRRAEFSDGIQCLAGPEIGAGIATNRIEQLLISSYLKSESDPAASVLAKLDAEGERLINEGKVVEDSAQAAAIMQTIWSAVHREKLPLLERLGALPASA